MFQAPEHPYVTIRWKEDRGYLNANFADVAEDAALMEDTFEPAALSATLAVELPFGYTQTYQPRVALLPVRGDPLSNGWNGYWRTDESSYDQIGTSAVFAMRGTLQAAFPASVLREDDFAELDVLLEAPDRTLEGVSYATALARAPIQVFVGSEIMLGYTATLVAAGRYRLKVLRARYGTRRGEHALNEPVFIVALGANPIFIRDVPWRGQPTFEFFKCQPFLLRAELDLEEVEPATVRLVWRAYRPPPPANLRVFGDGNAPTYSTRQDLVVDWDAASDARSFTPAPQDLPAQAERTLLVIANLAGTELAEIAIAGAAGPHTIANADLVAALGSETGFLLRAYFERGGLRSLAFDQVPVTKV
jgi:hypothetical protein